MWLPKDEQESTAAFFKSHGIAADKYKIGTESTVLFTYTMEKKAQGNGTLDAEILWRMMSDKRVFWHRNLARLKMEVAVRKAIVAAAKSVKFSFGLEIKHPKFDTKKFRWEGAPGDFINSWWDNDADKHRIGCQYGAWLAIWKGLLDTLEPHDRKWFDTQFEETRSFARLAEGLFSRGSAQNAEDALDFVPGDLGYIRNTAEKPEAGQEGQNIIYLGGSEKVGKDLRKEKVFWGLVSKDPIRSYDDWHEMVRKWNDKQPEEGFSRAAFKYWDFYPGEGKEKK